MSDLIDRQAAIDALANTKDLVDVTWTDENDNVIDSIEEKRNIIANWLEKVPSAQPEIKPIGYLDCANAMLKMWMDNVVTDGEYNRIMDKLNAHWRIRNE